MTSPDLAALGWSEALQARASGLLPEGHRVARVARIERRQILALGLEPEPTWVPVLGSVAFRGEADLPKLAVGDWVGVRAPGHPAVEIVLPRQSCLVRKKVQRRSEAQPIAANVDVVFVVTTVGRDLNVARLERYVAAVRDAGAEPVVVVNKVDLDHDPAEIAAVEGELSGVRVLRASASEGRGLDALTAALPPGTTAAFVGSSGVGKSTLVNAFLGGDLQWTRDVRAADEKGRHTTTTRQLFMAPSGALVIDNPGVREFGLWAAEEGVTETFSDVEAIVASCRFSDCTHAREPGCAVREALQDGTLSEARFERYLRLQRELEHEARRVSEQAPVDAKKRWKSIHKNHRTLRAFNRKHGLKD